MVTVEIPDENFREAKEGAGALGISRMQDAGEKPWLECAGELSYLHEETVRIVALIADEFERIEPEAWS